MNNVKSAFPIVIQLILVRRQKSYFNKSTPYFQSIENITPETLDECDREYDRLDDMYRARKSVLDAFEQWKLLVQQHAEFQVYFD